MEDVARTQLLDGVWSSPSSAAEWIEVVDPASGLVCARVAEATDDEVDRAVASAVEAGPAWNGLGVPARRAVLERLRALLEDRRTELAEIVSTEMGAPIGFSFGAQLGVALADLDVLLEQSRGVELVSEVSNSLVVRVPVGVVAAITPWNFPLHQIVLKVCPALLAGCTVVLKPSEVAPISAALFAELLIEAGLPAGALGLVNGRGPTVGAALAAHPRVDLVTFTGSKRGGEAVARAAASNITRVALELGGKSAGIVLDDADLVAAASEIARSCFANSGQTCAAVTRVLVPRAVSDQFERLLADAASAWLPGEPASPDTVLGPLASEAQREAVVGFIDRAVRDGARLVAGGSARPLGFEHGAWVSATVLADVDRVSELFREEVFGPVLAVTPYDSLDEAIELANDSQYGLAGGVWSGDARRALSVAMRIRTGTIGINGAGLDVGAPFGGVKASGVGREGGVWGYEEFLETKTFMGARGLSTALDAPVVGSV